MYVKGAGAEVKPCPECKGTNLIVAQTTLGRLPLTFIRCLDCGFKGPTSIFRDDAEGLWNAIPREEGKSDD